MARSPSTRTSKEPSAFGVLPVNVDGDLLLVAVCDPSNETVLAAVHRFTGFELEPLVAALPDLDGAIARHWL